MPQRKQSLQAASGSLEADIREGRFTPFYGAGASSLWSGEIDLGSCPWNEVSMTLTAIASRLGDRSRDFLRSFAAHRLSLAPADATTIIPPINQGLPPIDRPELCESLLVKLQAELVRAAVSLTNYFGVRFPQENPSIHLLENCGVEFDLASEDVVGALARDCLPRLLASADIALKLKSSRHKQRESPFLVQIPDIDRRLNRHAIYAQLLKLIAGLTGSTSEIVSNAEGVHALHQVQLGEKRTESAGRLRLDAIQWLLDLLWYTVRYWVPCYPTTTELAFELSLAATEGPPRRAGLAQAAQALDNLGPGSASRTVGTLVAYCEQVQEKKRVADRQIRAFYYAMAAALQYQFELYRAQGQNQKGTLKDRFVMGAAGRDSASRIPVPLAFTTNFDRALERVFEVNNFPFHLVFPVVRGSLPGDEHSAASPSWIIWTRDPNEKRPKTEWWWNVCDDEGFPKINFEGPIIVKLHGTPSLPLADSAIQHWVVLSELSYLEALMFRAPSWLEKQLAGGFRKEERRSLQFLGYSISDPNVRLRLYAASWEYQNSSRGALSKAGDFYDLAILESLGIDQHVGDLNDFPEIVLRLADDPLAKSPQLTRLLSKLAELY